MPQETVHGSDEARQRPLFVFNVSRYELLGPQGETIKLRPQSLEVFVLLLQHANEVVAKADILDTVWKDIAVTDDSVTQCIVDIRRALGNDHRKLLQTVPRIGYRLCVGADGVGSPIIALLDDQPAVDHIPPSIEHSDTTSGAHTALTDNQSTLLRSRFMLLVMIVSLLASIVVIKFVVSGRDNTVSHRVLTNRGPTLAVLPFDDMGGSAQDTYFSDGISEDIIALLSRFSELGMVSWSTVVSRSGSDEKIKTLAEQYGVHYLVSGSVRQDNQRVRVSVRLSDARDARLLWSERYDESLQDVFLVQDKIAKKIVATLSVKLTEAETELSRNIPTNNIEAYQLSLLGRSELRKRSREGNYAARERFAEAIELDPNFADAYIRLGETYLEDALFGWTEWPERSTEKALVLAKIAMEIGGANARSLGFLAQLHVRTGENDVAQRYLDRAFEFNPNDPSLHEIQGLIYLWNGNADKAIEHLEYVRRYDPDSTLGLSHLSTAYYVDGQQAEAIATLERMIETAPDALFGHVILTAALTESGDIDSARAAAEVVRRRHPFLTAEGASRTEFFFSEDVRRRFVQSLNRAGVE